MGTALCLLALMLASAAPGDSWEPPTLPLASMFDVMEPFWTAAAEPAIKA